MGKPNESPAAGVLVAWRTELIVACVALGSILIAAPLSAGVHDVRLFSIIGVLAFALVAIVGFERLRRVAEEESPRQAQLLTVPGYAFYYVATRFNRAARPFALLMFATGGLALAGIAQVAFSADEPEVDIAAPLQSPATSNPAPAPLAVAGQHPIPPPAPQAEAKAAPAPKAKPSPAPKPDDNATAGNGDVAANDAQPELAANAPAQPAQPAQPAPPAPPAQPAPKLTSPSGPRPPDADVVAQALFDLAGSDANRRRDALRKLREQMPGNDEVLRLKVSRAVETMLDDSDGGVRNDALAALTIWGGPESTPALVRVLDDKSKGMSGQVLEAFMFLRDPAAADAVARWVDKDGKAVPVLKVLGPAAEAPVIKILDHENVFVRCEACRILAEVGGPACLPKLTAIVAKKGGFDSDEARRALMVIRRRALFQNDAAGGRSSNVP